MIKIKSGFNFLKNNATDIVKGLFFVLLLVNIVLFSGYALNNNAYFRQFSNIYFLISTIILIFYFVLKLSFDKEENITSIIKRFILNKKTIYFLLLFFIYSFSFLIHMEFTKEGLSTLIINLCLLTFSFSFVNIICFDYFIKKFRIIFPIIALISLIVYVPSFFMDQPPYFFPFETSNDYYYNNFFFLCFQLLRSSTYRNCSIFWEPALFAVFINIGFLVEFFDKGKKPNLFSLIIYTLCLLTTFSTSGYIAFILVVFICLMRIDEDVLRKRFIIFFIIAAIIIVGAFFLSPSVKGKFANASVSFISRLYGPYVNLQVFVDRKLFGTGSLRESNYFYNKVIEMGLSSRIDTQVSTMGFFITAYGLLGLVPAFGVFMFLAINKKTSIFEKIYLSVFILIILNVEPLQLNLMIYILIFYIIDSDLVLTKNQYNFNLYSIVKEKIFSSSDDKNKTLAKN